MSYWKSVMRAQAAQRRREEREAIKLQREYARQSKERAKLSAIEQARLEVAAFENEISVLLSVHKDCAEPWDWDASATSLPPPRPVRGEFHEVRARQTIAVLPPQSRSGWEEKLEAARQRDEEQFLADSEVYERGLAEWKQLTELARKIRAGDAMAYGEAIDEISPLSSISHFGPSTEFTVHTPRILECVLGLSSTKVIPAESKTLTSTGKVSVKPWNTARFHEIYQDYICSCMLRVARELFALLPIEVLILTARIELLDSRTGHSSEQPVLSVALHRERLESLNFDLLDPSDTIESLLHRGDFKASRKSGAFAAITPFDLRDVRPTNLGGRDLEELVQRAKDLREEIRAAREMMSGVEN